jgi:DNA-binding transcriptional ArsR family regulator
MDRLPIGPFPEVQLFADADGGWMTMEHIISRLIHDDHKVRITPVSLHMREIARRFGGSRTNLLRLLEAGYEQGLLDAPPQDGKYVQFSSRMVCALLAYIASFLGNFHRHAEIGFGRLQAKDTALAA